MEKVKDKESHVVCAVQWGPFSEQVNGDFFKLMDAWVCLFVCLLVFLC